LSSHRVLILVGVLVAFIAAGAILIYANQSHGGANRTFNVTVTGAKAMSPETLSANKDDSLTISITSDTTGEVHLHGYDIKFACEAGKVTSHTFKAINSGDFEIEWEDTSTPLGHLVVS
jgi:hypothetical protein